ncbi:MAG: AAA-like domain-containing protein [Nostoc sp. NMS1]|uniref:AAA-like domain-containing protein n=1 Tax=unclassified Nostoc TaxID=2593658 RepID=UPI0025E1E42C|nr:MULTISPECIES: AAA-like domain-containing protein [unclassified Nostoc]MBN3905514.1 AAA-like domain-containing protein [Nostoc sp. NMS1]MBN3994057.1 AAA-like domain-containing protein [Nostoc sp. NMS2]
MYNTNYRYQLGGSLAANHPTYVLRQADEELYQAIKAGEFLYIFNCRQMGKSSLAVKVRQRLTQEQISCAYLDFTVIVSSESTPTQFYRELIYRLTNEFNLQEQIKLESWLAQHNHLSPTRQFTLLIEEMLLANNNSNSLVIFIDEIDKIFNFPSLANDFFSLLRAFYNQRAIYSNYEQLVICLIGVATPSDLITNLDTTPYNIGKFIELNGFSLTEARRSLSKGLIENVVNPDEVLRQILYWTGGQPFLTQKICKLVVQQKKRNPNIDKLVQTQIVEDWESHDYPQHLTYIKNRILNNHRLMKNMMTIYQGILQGEDVNVDNSDEQRQLLLSGLVIKERNKLKVYNPIYREVFNKNWVERQLETVRDAENLRRELSELGIKLRNQGHKFQGDEALILASLAKEFQDPKVEKVILLSHLSLAYLELEEFQKAEEEVKIALEYLDNNEEFQKVEAGFKSPVNDLDNNQVIDSVSQKLQTLVYAYYAQGSLSKKQGYLENAIKAYTRAFTILRNTLEKEIDILNQEILPLEIVESIHKNLIELFNNKQDTDFTTNDVICSLIKYLFLHYTPIQKLLEAKEWKKADEETYRLMTQKVGKEGIQMLVRSDFEKFPLEDLYVVNALWEKYSDGKFGFRRQKEIWLKSGSIGQAKLTPVIKFWQAVEWISSEGELEEIDLNEINYQLQQEKTPDGHLPTTGLRFQEVSLLSRFASCDVPFFDSLMSK